MSSSLTTGSHSGGGHQPVKRRASTGSVASGKRKREWLEGTTTGGKKVKFGAQRVETVVLTGSDGRTIGTSYPSKPDDQAKVTKWASRSTRGSDVRYTKDYGQTTQSVEPAPWSGGTVVYAHAHASKKSYSVTLQGTKKDPVPQKVRMSGEQYGRLLSRNKHLRKIYAKNPYAPMVMMSCSSGHPEGEAAKTAVAELRQEGHLEDVYAPSGTGVRLMTSDKSEYAVKPTKTASGTPVTGEFVKFPGPPPTGGTTGSP
jgi:hypothetical protein